MAVYIPGDRVSITAGKLKGREGTYLGPGTGPSKLSGRVRVDDDSKPFRSPRWTSFSKIETRTAPTKEPAQNASSTAGNPISKEDITAVIDELLYLEARMSKLRVGLEKRLSLVHPTTQN